MHPLLLALQLATLRPLATTATILTTPTHYVTTVGYLDLSQPVLPNTTLTRPVDTEKQTRGFIPGHSGIDYDARTGNPVYAAFAGRVVAVTHSGPYGNKILISHPTHPEKITTLYAHLNTVSVTEGQTVAVGDIIGAVGATGNADGDHLHFEVHVGDVAVDPVLYF